MVKNLLIKGNAKMGEDVYAFNLPPRKTCTPTHWCLQGREGKPACYTLRNNFLFSSVIRAAEERYKLSKRNDFSDRMIEEINKKDVDFFRLHASGDFYSEEYVEKIAKVVENCPDTLFRTTTRRRDLTDEIKDLNSLPNIVVRESLDTERTRPEMGLPFAALDSLDISKSGNVYECINHCPTCDYHCWKDDINIYFKEK